jgi:hypothetical protein
VGHYAKVVLDEVFGRGSFRNHIVVRSTFAHADANQFGSLHQSIFWYSKTENWIFNNVFVQYEEDYVEKYYRYSDPDGRKWLSCKRPSRAEISHRGVEHQCSIDSNLPNRYSAGPVEPMVDLRNSPLALERPNAGT